MPCAGAGDYEWVRVGPVVTLGELFVQLGKFFTAKHIRLLPDAPDSGA